MNYTVLNAQRQQIGPIPEHEVRRLLETRVVTLESLAWKPGMSEWLPLRSFEEFIDVPNQPPVISSSPANPYAAPASTEYFPKGTGSADMNAPSSVRAQALTDEVLARGYQLDVMGCISRGWNLVFSQDFWGILGVHTLTWLTLVASSMCYANIVVGGPIMGGVHLYFLRKIRGQEATLSTAFSGFNLAFSQLFLVFLIASLLSGVGFLLCIIPGIYLSVAYTFANALVIDKQLNFWDAMECSRKVISAHWFQIFGLLFLLGLCMCLGLLALIIGIFIVMPIAQAALMYAYEDIFHPNSASKRYETA